MTLELKTRQLDRSLARHGPSRIVVREPSAAPRAAMSLWKRRAVALMLVVLAVATCEQPTLARTPKSRYSLPPKILVLRGVFEVFSLGMNDLTKKLASCGYDVKVTSWSLALHEAQCADQQPYVVIGHSLGGRMCAWVSRKLMGCGKRVPLIIIVDANLIQPIPANVDKCLHLYVTNSTGLFHGSPVRGESRSTQIINWDVSKGQPSWYQGGVNHFDIDATPWVHQIIIDEIARTFPLPPAMAISRELARGSVAALPAPSAVTPPASEKMSSLPRTRRIPWSPSRPEASTPEQEQRPPSLAWQPYRPETNPRSSTDSRPPGLENNPSVPRTRQIPWSPARPETTRPGPEQWRPSLAWRPYRPKSTARSSTDSASRSGANEVRGR